MKTFTEVSFGEFVSSNTSVTLRAQSASSGGGSEVLVICGEEYTEKLPHRSMETTTEEADLGGGARGR